MTMRLQDTIVLLSLGLLLCSLFCFADDNEEHRLSRWAFRGQRASPGTIASVSASPTLLNDGDEVTVSFSVDDVSYTALFLAAVSPSTTDLTLTAPVEYYDLGKMGSKGEVTFALVNMRADYSFVLFNGTISSPIEIARSNLVTFENLNAPLRPRLMHTQIATDMQILWSSQRVDLNPRVIYYPATSSSHGAMTVAVDNVYTYSVNDMCGPPATTVGWRDPGYFNMVVLKNLLPGTEYFYQVGDDSEMSEVFRFTQPAPTFPYSIVTYADEGQSTTDGAAIIEDFPPAPQTMRRTLAAIENANAQLVIHHGDISYARGYAADWDIFAAMNAKVFSRVPYAVALGNHEADWPDTSSSFSSKDSGGECSIPTQLQYPMPQPGLNKPFFYFVSGPAFVLLFSTEHDFMKGSEQYNYIQKALTSVDRSVTPWVIVAGHRPMYIDSTNNNTDIGDLPVAKELQKELEPLLLDAGGAAVDITLWGHHHSYQRMCAVYGGDCMQGSEKDVAGRTVYRSPAYPIALVVGTAGAGFSRNIQIPRPSYCEFVAFDHGIAQITLHNQTALEWSFINSSTGDVVDSFWLIK